MRRLLRFLTLLHEQVPLFYKVVIANAVLIAFAALATAAVALRGTREPQWGIAELVLLATSLSILVNYLLVRLAFGPLFFLRQTMEEIRRGDFAARAPRITGDPDVDQLTETFNLMLDRLAEHRRSVAQRVLRALEDERRRIARELHDETSQALTNLIIRLEMVMQGTPDPRLRDELAALRDLAVGLLEGTRRLTFELRPTILDDLGLVPALRWYVKHHIEPLGLDVDLQVRGLERRLPDEVETALYRIVQEALVNVVRHAGAARVRVVLEERGDRLQATVEDDGRGFDVTGIAPDDPRGRGLGIFGMRERAELVGGRLVIDSAPGRGTRVTVRIPLDRLPVPDPGPAA